MAAVGSDKVASVVGYQLSVLLQNSTSNLPQRVAVLCEANTANQDSLDVSEWEATSIKAVGDRYGYGSPAYQIARIMMPILDGIPLVFYPQEEAPGATAKVFEITPVGTATGSATHTIKVAGRDGVDAQFYSFTVAEGDTAADITAKITDTLTAVLGCPVSSTDTDYVAQLTSKWKGETADALTIEMDTDGNDVGITYAVDSIQDGAGIPSIAAALTLMEPKWNTIGINSYGTITSICSALEAWTGIPDPETPTGRYIGTVMKPIIWLTGSVAEDPSSFTDPRKAQVAISISPAPLGLILPMEVAASDAGTWAVVAQNKPGLDVLNKRLIDIPAPTIIGAMSDYSERDRIVKLGCSTVNLINGNYVMLDPVTTYHPDGDLRPAFRWRRDLMVDFNMRYRYRLLEEKFLIGKIIAPDSSSVSSPDIIKPIDWKQILISSWLKPAEQDGLITNIAESVEFLIIGIDEDNPNRFNTFTRYFKTGVARISATEAQSGVVLGTPISF